MLTMPEFAFLALCRLARPLASPGPRCSSVDAGVPFMRKYPSAAPVTTPSNRPSTQRMPSTRSSAATKCISEVPGLAKQTSTPPATNVRTRLSAPFMISLHFATVLEASQDQSLFTRFVKGLAAHCSHRFRCVAFFNRGISICRPHGLVGCEVAAIMAFPSGPIFREEENDPRFCFIVCGADGAGGRRPCTGTEPRRLLRPARHHGRRPQFPELRRRIEPDPAHDRQLRRQLRAGHHPH